MTDVLAHLTNAYPLLFTILVVGCVTVMVIAIIVLLTTAVFGSIPGQTTTQYGYSRSWLVRFPACRARNDVPDDRELANVIDSFQPLVIIYDHTGGSRRGQDDFIVLEVAILFTLTPHT